MDYEKDICCPSSIALSEKITCLMHQETDVEADRQHVRVKAKKNTDNN